MAIAPNTDNYVLGKGRIFFNPMVNGVAQGERALGNAPSMSFSLAIEKLDHFSSQSGLRAKDKTVITQVTPSMSFTLDEINGENLNMLTMGNKVVQTQVKGQSVGQTLTAGMPTEGYYYETGKRNIGIWKLVYSGVTNGPFDDGETITGSTSTDTAVVRRDKTAANTLYITSFTGTDPYFQVGETITGGSSAATATVTTAAYFDTTDAVVTSSNGLIHFDVGTDFYINSRGGLIGIAENTALDQQTGPKYTVAFPDASWTKITGLANTSLEGMIRFVSDNPEGTQLELRAWKVNLQPDGDTGFIGEDWATISFTGEILKDETNHPTAPYMEILVG